MLKTLVKCDAVDGSGVLLLLMVLMLLMVNVHYKNKVNLSISGNPVGKTWATLSGLGATKDPTVAVNYLVVGLSSLRRSGRKGQLSFLALGICFCCTYIASCSLEHLDFQ